MMHESDEALDVLRGVWNVQGQGAEDLAEACGNTKSCKNMENVGFEAMAADGDVNAAWRATLEREGKRNPGAGSVRDLVLGPAEPGR